MIFIVPNSKLRQPMFSAPENGCCYFGESTNTWDVFQWIC